MGLVGIKGLGWSENDEYIYQLLHDGGREVTTDMPISWHVIAPIILAIVMTSMIVGFRSAITVFEIEISGQLDDSLSAVMFLSFFYTIVAGFLYIKHRNRYIYGTVLKK